MRTQMTFTEIALQMKVWVFMAWGGFWGGSMSIFIDKSGELLFVAVAAFLGAFMGALGKWAFGKFVNRKK